VRQHKIHGYIHGYPYPRQAFRARQADDHSKGRFLFRNTVFINFAYFYSSPYFACLG